MKDLIKQIVFAFIFFVIIPLVLISVFSQTVNAYTKPKPIFFYGDTHSSYTTHKKIVAGIKIQNPGIVFHAGDLVSYKYDLSDWINFDLITKNLRKSTRYLPAIGNHDAYTGYFTERFSLPRGGRYYSTTYRRLYLIVLDSNANFKYDTHQYNWLKRSLIRARKLKKTTIVIFHHPPISSDGGEYNSKRLLPLFKKYRVRMVFNGHYHHYERSYYNKAHYIVTGGGGATLYPLGQIGPFSRKYVKSYHFCRLDQGKYEMRLTVYDRDLNRIDRGRMGY